VLELIKGINLAVRFLLELCALGALGYWGFKTGSTTIAKIALLVGAQASVQLPGLVVMVLQVLVFGSAAAALVATGHRTLALVFVATVVINALLMYVWGQ
jgi:Zn-dependent protease